jgi:hypothetical protein
MRSVLVSHCGFQLDALSGLARWLGTELGSCRVRRIEDGLVQFQFVHRFSAQVRMGAGWASRSFSDDSAGPDLRDVSNIIYGFCERCETGLPLLEQNKNRMEDSWNNTL